MNILKTIVNSAASQFGREFGRAGANKILKGSNSYTVVNTAYNDRIKPSDPDIIKAIKQINKITFVTSDKGNVSRLIELVNIVDSVVNFNGDETLDQFEHVIKLFEVFNIKKDHGYSLISDNYTDKSLDHLHEIETNLKAKVDKFNMKSQKYVSAQLKNIKIKNKKTAIIFAIFLGMFGGHWFYLKKYSNGVYSIIFSITGIPYLIAIINVFTFLIISKTKFDMQYNSDFVYYSQFNY